MLIESIHSCYLRDGDMFAHPIPIFVPSSILYAP